MPDAMTMRRKKGTGIVNMGGFIAMHDEELYRQVLHHSTSCLKDISAMGGMSGRDTGSARHGTHGRHGV